MTVSKSRRILMVCGLHYGHFTGSIEIIKDLVAIGHKVTCLVLEDFKDRIKDVGVEIITFEADISKLILPPSAPPVAYDCFRITRGYDKIINTLLNNKNEYDYYVFDSIFDVNEMNKILKLDSSKFILLCTLSIFTDEDPSLFSEQRLIPFMMLNRKYNINLKDVLVNHFSPNNYKKLILNSKLFHLRSEETDEKCFFMGPSFEECQIDKNFDFKKDNNRKLIYISFGTIYDDRGDRIFEDCIKAFKDSEEYQLVLSVGNFVDVTRFKDVPNHISIFRHVPQNQLLQDVDIFITHGGLNSIGEALFNDVPIIVIPHNYDQFDNARIIEKLGAGIYLNKHQIKITENVIKEAVKNIELNKAEYKLGMDKIVESFKEARNTRSRIYDEVFI